MFCLNIKLVVYPGGPMRISQNEDKVNEIKVNIIII